MQCICGFESYNRLPSWCGEFGDLCVPLTPLQPTGLSQGATAFVSALVTNNSIIALNVEQNGVSEALKDEIEDALFLNQQPIALKKVLYCCSIFKKQIRSLLDDRWNVHWRDDS